MYQSFLRCLKSQWNMRPAEPAPDETESLPLWLKVNRRVLGGFTVEANVGFALVSSRKQRDGQLDRWPFHIS